ncbi:MAG TPA: GTPase, partial [Actinomycetota bacterium]
MLYGAGVVAARQHGAAEIVDPREQAVGSMKDIYAKYRIGPVLPAMGYSDEQLREFESMINAAPADVVVIATPIDLRKLVEIHKPAVRAYYELEEAEGSPTIEDALRAVLT